MIRLIDRYPGVMVTLVCLASVGVLLVFHWVLTFAHPPINTDGWDRVVEDKSYGCTPYEPEVRPCPAPSPVPVEHHHAD